MSDFTRISALRQFDVVTLGSLRKNKIPAKQSRLRRGVQNFIGTLLNRKSLDAKGRKTNRRRSQAQFFVEDLGNSLTLEMVAIPGGTFEMGSPETEVGSNDSERPQHQVTVKPFYMGKYPVTQAQWKAVAALPQVNHHINPDPSCFKGADRPVEQVSWHDAVEFCARLSKKTGREYRLPSEAEWEYACRAGTTTPFYFGKTITTELANYNGDYSYSSGPKGVFRQETTTVGSFQFANAFGLYDMHGNVSEWCHDHWHKNYERAPSDESTWLSDDENQYRVVRGGSYHFSPESCRSASRDSKEPDVCYEFKGFRVVCALVSPCLGPNWWVGIYQKTSKRV